MTGFRSSKAQALLYYLAVTGRPHTRPTLAGLFWGDQPETAARTSLSKCLSNLRDLLGDAVLVDRQTIAFNRNQPYDLDTEHFLAGIAQPLTPKTIPSWQAALALYRGDFLEGFYVRGTPDFEQWVLVQRAHYREAVVQGLHTLANYFDQQDDLSSAITHTRRLLTLEPWREDAHRQLIARLARSGQRAAALAQFETCRRVLEEELAVEPDAETMALVEAIRVGEFDKMIRWQNGKVNAPQEHPVTLSPPLPVAPPLPTPPTPLIGRERELAELGELISNPQCRLITLTGPGGMGKTRLALAVAEHHLAAHHFRHGACFVSLAAIDDVQAILPTLMNALGLSLESSQDSIEAQKHRLLTFLTNKQMLLIFDNFEQVMEGRTLLLEILRATLRVQIIVTSRERLHLHGEQIYPLSGLACPATVVDKDAPALALFLRTAQRTSPHFQSEPPEGEALVAICQLVAGMPLALELAARWIHVLTPSAIAEALRTNLDLLTADVYDLPARHRTMRATFDATWGLLTEHERQMFAQLSVFRGGFTRAAAQQIAGATIQQLSTLTAKSLIEYRQATDRYEMHELLRQYGAEKLPSLDPHEGTRARHLLYYLEIAEHVEPHDIAERASTIEDLPYRQPYWELDTKQEVAWYDSLECNHDNVRTALHSALATHPQAALRLAGALGEFWCTRGYYSEGRSWLRHALAQYTGAPSRAQGWALRKAGKLAIAQGDYAEATTLWETSLAVYQHLGDAEGMASTLNFLGVAALYQGEQVKAEQLLTQSLALRYQLNNREDIAATLHNLSLVAMRQQNVPQAMAWLDESFAVFGVDRVAEAGSIYGTSAGYLKLYQADPAAAVAHFLPTVSLALAQRDQPTIIDCLEGLAVAGCLNGTQQAVQQQAVRLLSVAEALRVRLGVLRTYVHFELYEKSIATLHTHLSEPDFAAAWAEGETMSPEQAIAAIKAGFV